MGADDFLTVVITPLRLYEMLKSIIKIINVTQPLFIFLKFMPITNLLLILICRNI